MPWESIETCLPVTTREPSFETSSSDTVPVSALPLGVGGDDLGRPGVEVTLVDGEIAARVGAWLEGVFGGEEQLAAVGGEVLGDLAFGLGRGWNAARQRAGHSLDQFPVRQPHRDAGFEAAPVKQGLQRLGPAKARVFSARVGFAQDRGEGAGGGVQVRGEALVVGGPAVCGAGCQVGVGAFVGRVPGAGDRAGVGGVEELVGGQREAAERALARRKVGLDVIAAGVGRRDELEGTAVGQALGERLLAGEGVGAGIGAGWQRVGLEDPVGAVGGTGGVGRDHARVVGGSGLQATDVEDRFLREVAQGYLDFWGVGAIRGGGPVFEVVVGLSAAGHYLPVELGTVGADFINAELAEAEGGRGRLAMEDVDPVPFAQVEELAGRVKGDTA